jgi:hypothetical protein
MFELVGATGFEPVTPRLQSTIGASVCVAYCRLTRLRIWVSGESQR